jgi:hypothetical protein
MKALKIPTDTIADGAESNVDKGLLRRTGTGGWVRSGYFPDGPLIDHLEDGEVLHHTLSNLTKGVVIDWANPTRTDKQEEIEPATNYRTAALITNERTVFVVGQEDEEQVHEIPHSNLQTANTKVGFFKDKLVLDAVDAKYKMYTRKGSGTAAAVDYLKTIAEQSREPESPQDTSQERRPQEKEGTTDGEESDFHGSTSSDEDRTASDTGTEPEDSDIESSEEQESPSNTQGDQSTADTGAQSADEEPIDTVNGLSELPSEAVVKRLDSSAQIPIEEAAERLSPSQDSATRTDLIRAHTNLCTILDIVGTADSDAIQQIETVLDEIETHLAESTLPLESENENSATSMAKEEDQATSVGNDEPGTGAGEESGSYSVEVHVADESGGAIPEASVTLDDSDFVTSETTDSDGRCVLTVPAALNSSELELTVKRAGFEATSGSVPVEPGRVYSISLESTESGTSTGSGQSSEADGQDPSKDDDGPSRSDLIEEVHRLDEDWSSDVDRRLMLTVGEYHPDDYISEFGSWDRGISSAEEYEGKDKPRTANTETGQETTPDQPGQPTATSEEEQDIEETADSTETSNHREALLEELQELDASWSEVDRKLVASVGEYSVQEYEEEFGGLNAALFAADIGDREPTEVSEDTQQDTGASSEANSSKPDTSGVSDNREALLEELQELDASWSEVDRKLIDSVGEFSMQEYEEEFGSLDAALFAAGIGSLDTPSSNSSEAEASDAAGQSDGATTTQDSATSDSSGAGKRYSRSEILGEIRRLTEELGDAPTTTDFQSLAKMSPGPVYREFDSWSDALAAADASAILPSSSSDSGGASPQSEDASTVGQDTLSPNETAELYEAFGRFQAFLDSVCTALEFDGNSPTQLWYESIRDRWGGSGPEDAPSYGDQQRDRNTFSMDDYRDEFGDGDAVTEFKKVDLVEPDEHIRTVLPDSIGSLENVVPVAPESGDPLPVVVRSQAELEAAQELLAEFPSNPEADKEQSGDGTEKGQDATSEEDEIHGVIDRIQQDLEISDDS